ncbi:hypothetical protein CEP51_005572 [Fusarium floridanum]|uniref:Uncharacterized protein n=1 Tax=Fusarium floridanum TaxID=1325733 RepID=A0A428RWB6_9HYPO|nr:hypothetical protein CEP51_005572 [Fusarium floridanum]
MPESTQPSQEDTRQLQETLAENPLQADDTASIADSSFGGSDSSSDYTSINSSIRNYKYENGRRYHAFREGAYLVPNDDDEQDRMDLGHHIYRLILGGKLYLAPIKEPQRVLDLGTGTGIWAMEFADEFPSAQVLGTDLSPIQPTWTPPNCIFEVDDFESPWLYKQPFDYIHARELGGCISSDKHFFDEAFKHLKPGGYLEMQAVYTDFKSDDGTKDKAESAVVWMKHMVDGTAKFGKPLDCAIGWKKAMEDAGFEDVQQQVYKCPIGQWPKDRKLKEIGKYQAAQESQVITSYTPALFSRVLGWQDDEIQVFMAKVKKDLTNPAVHLYLPVYFIWGRKPEQ